jgi:hypothetical protein
MKHTHINNKQGFALIVSLGIMSLILLLILAMASQIKVHIKESEASQRITQSRLSAKLALNLAIAQLQKSSGSDQRITARSDILTTTTEDEKYWTGVWDADPTSSTYSKLVDWLVNQNRNENTQQVKLAEGVFLHPTTLDDFEYAFWIGDEGIKADIGFASKTATQNLTPYNYLSSQKTGIANITGFEIFKNNNQIYDNLNKVISRSQLPLLDNSLSLLPTSYFHNTTIGSRAVFSDTKNGGLQIDLSALLHKNGPTISKYTGSDQIFDQLVSNPSDAGGPRWNQLKSYYNLAEALSGSDGNASIKPSQQTEDVIGISPILTQFYLYFYITAVDDGTEKWLRMHYFPIIALWNPYNATIEASNYYVTLENMENLYPSETLALRADPRFWAPANGTLYASGNLYENADRGNPINTFGSTKGDHHFYFKLEAPAIPPGQTILFSSDNNTELHETDYLQNVLRPGLRKEKYLFRDSNIKYPINRTFKEVRIYFRNSFGLQAKLGLDPNNPLQTHARWGNGGRGNYTQSGGTWEVNTATSTWSNRLQYSFPNATSYPHNTYPDIHEGNYPGYPAGGIKSQLNFIENDTITDRFERVKLYSHYNPRANFTSRSPLDQSIGGTDAGYQEGNPLITTSAVAQTTYASIEASGNNGFSGLSTTSSYGSDQAVLFDIPRSTSYFSSIGSLMHAKLTPPGTRDDYYTYYRFDFAQPSFPIGNSNPNVILGYDSVYKNSWLDFNGWPGEDPDYAHYDYSYWLNESLWDKYFFSTIPTSGTINNDLPDGRKKIISNLNKSEVIDEIRTPNQAASHVLLNGSFNINSTSLSAWKAFYGSFLGTEVASATSGISSNETSSPFVHSSFPLGGALDASKSNPYSTRNFAGYRALNSDEIDLLAIETVKQIKERGPFLSLAHFINRSVNPSDPISHKAAGVIQAAINESKINKNLEINVDSSEFDSPKNGSYTPHYDTSILGGNLADNTPGTLTQGLILQRNGNMIRPRSDTFTIRAYGKHPLNKKGTWCEAIVQRMPEYIDNSQTPDQYPEGVNKKYGRKFNIISLKWLNESSL